jgi:molybdenum cofactor guanylyltransferase
MDILENDLINNNFRKVEKWADKIGVETINVKIDKFDPFFQYKYKNRS